MTITRNMLTFWCSALLLGTAFGQSNFTSTSVVSNATGNIMCTDQNPIESACSGSYQMAGGSDLTIDFWGTQGIKASYGPLKAETYSAIDVFGEGELYSGEYSLASATAQVFDTLSINGLQGGETAYLSGDFSVLGRPIGGDIFGTGRYSIDLGETQPYAQCTVDNDKPPHCSLTLLIGYSGGQPIPFYFVRNLYVEAVASLAPGSPAGSYAQTGVEILGAYTSFKVVNAKGSVISGVTVVGSSGQVYN
jgi:hypothetical protein